MPEYWLKAFSAGPPGVRVVMHPTGGSVVYGHRIAPAAGAFATAFDRHGTQQWDAPLGEGHVARVTIARSGFLATGYRTIDYLKGEGDGFIARLGNDGAVGFQTPWGYAFGRGAGVGEDGAGNITAAGLSAPSGTDANGWDVTLVRFAPTGAKTDAKVINNDAFFDRVDDAAIDSEGNAYLVSHSTFDDFAKVTPAGTQLWGVARAGIQVAIDPAGNVHLLSADRLATFSPIGTKISETTWQANPNEVARALAIGPQGRIAIAGQLIRKRDSYNKISVSDALVLVFDAAGQRIGRRALNGTGIRTADSIAFDTDGALVLSGSYDQDLDLAQEGPSLKRGSGDHFVARIEVPTTP